MTFKLPAIDTTDRADDRIVYWDDAAGVHKYRDEGAGGGLSKGTSFPVSPSSGDLFYRTDDMLLYQYDGTRWLCSCLHELVFSVRTAIGSGFTSDQQIGQAPTRGSEGDLYVEDLIVMAFANGGAFDASNRWAINISTRDSANTNTALGSVNMNSQTSNTWKEWTAAIDTVVDGSTELAFNLEADETGSPGSLISGVRVTYRRVGA